MWCAPALLTSFPVRGAPPNLAFCRHGGSLHQRSHLSSKHHRAAQQGAFGSEVREGSVGLAETAKPSSGSDVGCLRAWSRPASADSPAGKAVSAARENIRRGDTGPLIAASLRTIGGSRVSSWPAPNASAVFGERTAVGMRAHGVHTTAPRCDKGGEDGTKPKATPDAKSAKASGGGGKDEGGRVVATKGGGKGEGKGDTPQTKGRPAAAAAAEGAGAPSGASPASAEKGKGAGATASEGAGAAGGSGGGSGAGGVVGDLPHQVSELYVGETVWVLSSGLESKQPHNQAATLRILCGRHTTMYVLKLNLEKEESFRKLDGVAFASDEAYAGAFFFYDRISLLLLTRSPEMNSRVLGLFNHVLPADSSRKSRCCSIYRAWLQLGGMVANDGGFVSVCFALVAAGVCCHLKADSLCWYHTRYMIAFTLVAHLRCRTF